MKDESGFSSWWRQLAPRERRLISWGGAGLVIALGYAYVWQPLSAERLKLRASLPQLRADSANLSSLATEALQLRQSAPAPLSGPALQAAIQQAMNEMGINLKGAQITMLDEHRVNLSIQQIAFDRWTTLATLMQSRHARLESCSVTASPEAGLVQVQALISTGSK